MQDLQRKSPVTSANILNDEIIKVHSNVKYRAWVLHKLESLGGKVKMTALKTIRKLNFYSAKLLTSFKSNSLYFTFIRPCIQYILQKSGGPPDF